MVGTNRGAAGSARRMPTARSYAPLTIVPKLTRVPWPTVAGLTEGEQSRQQKPNRLPSSAGKPIR
jgi:hypothetical protein